MVVRGFVAPNNSSNVNQQQQNQPTARPATDAQQRTIVPAAQQRNRPSSKAPELLENAKISHAHPKRQATKTPPVDKKIHPHSRTIHSPHSGFKQIQ